MGGSSRSTSCSSSMDGIDNPPFLRRFFTNRINAFLDASTSSRAGSAA